MSVNLFGMVEIRDRDTGKWEYAPLYRKDKNGEYKEVDMFRGQSSYVNAVFGREPFDSSEEYFTSKSLDAIADIIIGGRSFPMEELSDTCRKKLEINFDIGHAYFTCFTGQDINILGVLAGRTSKEAYDFFTTFFGNIVSVLDVVGTSYDVYDLRRIRVILYAV